MDALFSRRQAGSGERPGAGIHLGRCLESRQGVRCRGVGNGEQGLSPRLVAKTAESHCGRNLYARIRAFEGLGKGGLGDSVDLGSSVGQGPQGMLRHGGIIDQLEKILVRLCSVVVSR